MADRVNIKDPDLQKYENILIFPHVMPDGDAIGSCAAMYYALKNMGKNAWIVSDDEIPYDLKFISKDLMTPMKDIIEQQISYDFCISIDSSDMERLGERKALVTTELWNIDHHATNDLFGEYYRVIRGASSSCEVLYDYFVSAGIEIDVDMAEALYVGISTDTGSFKYSSTTASTHRAVAHLLEIGIDLQKISVNVYQSKLKPKMMLEKLAVDNMVSYADGNILLTYADAQSVKALDADFSMTDGIVEILRDIQGVELAVYLKELSPSEVKVSLRSKEFIDVSEIAYQKGGGGHKRAAGFSILNSNLGIVDLMKALGAELEERFF